MLVNTGNAFKWNILLTKRGQEQKALFNLKRKHVQHYCPLIKCRSSTVRSKKNMFVPLFPSYVFVHVNEHLLAKAIKVKGVLNCMYWLNSPAVVSNCEIQVVRHLLKENIFLQLQRSKIDLQRSVEVTIYPKDICTYEHTAGATNQIKVNLPSLGYCLTGEVNHCFKLFHDVNEFVI